MVVSAQHLLFAAASAGGSSVLTMAFLGRLLFFAVLVVVCLALLAQGRAIAALGRSKADTAVQAAVAAPAQNPVPAVGPGVTPHVVAAITAAVAAMEDGNYAVSSIEVAKTNGQCTAPALPAKKDRGQWGLAAVAAYTDPF